MKLNISAAPELNHSNVYVESEISPVQDTNNSRNGLSNDAVRNTSNVVIHVNRSYSSSALYQCDQPRPLNGAKSSSFLSTSNGMIRPASVSFVNCVNTDDTNRVTSNLYCNQFSGENVTTTTTSDINLDQMVNTSNGSCCIQVNEDKVIDKCDNFIKKSDSIKSSSVFNINTDSVTYKPIVYTSTEAQTDELAGNVVVQTIVSPTMESINDTSTNDPVGLQKQLNSQINRGSSSGSITREQRRWERRLRRQARLASVSYSRGVPTMGPSGSNGIEMVPDILDSHLPPPYSTLPLITTQPSSIMSSIYAPNGLAQTGDRHYTFQLPIMRRSPSERSSKGCCNQWFAGTSLKSVIALIAFSGIACALGGAALGATGLAGSAHYLTTSLLMIGVGVVLISISGAAWRLTSPGASQCLGMVSRNEMGRCGSHSCNGRAPQGLLYPEFHYRPPPPSYQASMQEYRLRLYLLERNRNEASGVIREVSPPPTYHHSYAGSTIRQNFSIRPYQTETMRPRASNTNSNGVSNRCTTMSSNNNSVQNCPHLARKQSDEIKPNDEPVTSRGARRKNCSKNHLNKRNNKNKHRKEIQQLNNIYPSSQSTNEFESKEIDSITVDNTTSMVSSDKPERRHYDNGIMLNSPNGSSLMNCCSSDCNSDNNSSGNMNITQTTAELHNLDRFVNNINNDDCESIDNNVDAQRRDLVTIVTISGCDNNETNSSKMDVVVHL